MWRPSIGSLHSITVQGPELVRRLQEHAGLNAETERGPYPTRSYLKGFKQRRDLAECLERSSGLLGWGVDGRERDSEQ